MKITGKVKFGKVEIETFNQIMFGEPTTTTGVKVVQANEAPAGGIPGTPFQIVVANGGGGKFVKDLGVLFSTTGAPLQQVASAPAAGQYSVTIATGTYLFNTADTGKLVKISYVWTDASNGRTLTILNRPMGFGPICELWLMNPYLNTEDALRIFQARFGKLTYPLKSDDYVIPEMDFTAYSDAVGNLMEWYQTSG